MDLLLGVEPHNMIRTYMWQGYIQWLLPFVTNPLHWVMCTNPHLPTERSVTPWLSASTCFYWNHKCFTWGWFRSCQWSGTDHQCATLMSPNQGETAVLALPSFVGWLGRQSLVAANSTSCPPGHGISFLLTWSGWRNIQWLLPFVTNPLHRVMCTNPHLPTATYLCACAFMHCCRCLQHFCSQLHSGTCFATDGLLLGGHLWLPSSGHSSQSTHKHTYTHKHRFNLKYWDIDKQTHTEWMY